jgi:hypothetical protein
MVMQERLEETCLNLFFYLYLSELLYLVRNTERDRGVDEQMGGDSHIMIQW